MKFNSTKKITAFLPSLLISLASCSSLISVFNQVTYENAVTLKVESLALMNKATAPFADHAQEV